MATEIERKFLITSDAWREGPPGVRICQGYLSLDPERTVRVRLKGEEGFLTIMGSTSGIGRKEFEYSIPFADAEALLKMCDPAPLEKIRYERRHAGKLWEIDEFGGENEGLVVAEIELESEDESFEKPAWVGEEVSGDARYYNSSLVEHPWSEWDD